MILELYVFLFIIGIGSFGVGVWKKHIAGTLLSFIIFTVLAITALKIEYISAGATIIIEDVAYMYLSWLLSFMSAIFTLVGAVSIIKSDKGVKL